MGYNCKHGMNRIVKKLHIKVADKAPERKPMRHRLLLLFLAASIFAGFPKPIAIGSRASDSHALIGSRAPEWKNRDWINSQVIGGQVFRIQI